MDCLFLYDEADICADRFEEAIKQSGASYLRMSYSELAAQSFPFSKLDVDSSTRLLARFPFGFSSTRNNEMLLSMLINTYSFSFVLDKQIYARSLHQFEDKLYHSFVYEKLGIPYAEILDRKNLNKRAFPIIVKRRHASLGRGNIVVKSELDLEELRNNSDLSHHVFHTFHELDGDYRLLFLGDEYVGAVSRKIIVHDDGRVGVKVEKSIDLPEEVVGWCRKIMTVVPGDFMGFDVGGKMNGEYFMIENNLNPAFLGVERETGWDVAGRVVDYVLKGGK